MVVIIDILLLFQLTFFIDSDSDSVDGYTVPAIKPGRFSLWCQNTPLMGTETKMDDSILFPVKSSYIFG